MTRSKHLYSLSVSKEVFVKDANTHEHPKVKPIPKGTATNIHENSNGNHYKCPLENALDEMSPNFGPSENVVQ
jgi:hypothetical protein